MIPAILLQIYVFSVGVGFLAQGTVFFRDIQHIYSAVTTAWMYLTPIFPLTNYQRIYNGLSSMNQCMRILRNSDDCFGWIISDVRLIFYGFTVAGISLILGSIVFLKRRISLFCIFRLVE